MSTANKINKDKHYLIEFIGPENISDVSVKSIIYSKDSNGRQTEKITFTNIHTAALVKDDKLLILGEYKTDQ